MPTASFPATARLHSSVEFRAVFAHGKTIVRAGLVVITTPTNNGHARLGLALAKRRIARAVDRNRVKRTVRESFRHHRQTLAALDIVVLARSRTAKLSNAELFAQLADIWLQLLRLDDGRNAGAAAQSR